jgi:hypothetical protein
MYQQIFKLAVLPSALVCFGLLSTLQAADETTSNANTGEGMGALQSVTTGTLNTGVGFGALFTNMGGSGNTAIGVGALFSDTADRNTATGALALFKNDTGSENTADGVLALENNTGGNGNTAVGDSALSSNTTANNNTAVGFNALLSNATNASQNTAVGAGALQSNTGGADNTAVGVQALSMNTGNALLPTGIRNTAVGESALSHNTTGNSNIAVGFQAGRFLDTGSNNIDIYDQGLSGESNTIRIGTLGTHTKTFIQGIRGTTTANMDAITVVIDSSGQLGTVSSSERFKREIKAMEQSSEAVLRLRPVTFRYKNDSKGIPQFGLIAEEVAKVNQDLVVRDVDGKVYTVRYDAVNAMLLNEFLKEHRKVAKQEATIAKQQRQIDALTRGLQKVSAQLEVSKAAPQTVVNSH